MTYTAQLIVLCAISGLLALSAYLPLASGAMVICLGAATGAGAVVVAAAPPLNPFASVLLGGLAGGVLMFSVAALLARVSGFVLAIATVAIAETARTLVESQPALGGPLGIRLTEPHLAAIPATIALISVILLLILFEQSLMRRALAIAIDDPPLAISLGVDLGRMRIWMMTAGGIIAGIAGSLYILNFGVLDPRAIGFEGGLQIATFAIVGGRRSLWGPLLCALTLTLVPELLRFTTANRAILYGTVLMAAILVRAPAVRARIGTLRFIGSTRLWVRWRSGPFSDQLARRM